MECPVSNVEKNVEGSDGSAKDIEIDADAVCQLLWCDSTLIWMSRQND